MRTGPDSSQAEVFSLFLSPLDMLTTQYNMYYENDKKLLQHEI